MFLKSALPSLICPLLPIGVLIKITCKLANRVELDEITRKEPSDLDLHCWHIHLRQVRSKGIEMVSFLYTLR